MKKIVILKGKLNENKNMKRKCELERFYIRIENSTVYRKRKHIIYSLKRATTTKLV